MRSKACIHTLTGHTNTVADVKTQATEPQIITASHDCTVRYSTDIIRVKRGGVYHQILSFDIYERAPENKQVEKVPDTAKTSYGHFKVSICL